MTAYHFEGYMLRPVDDTDWNYAVEWTAADPDHRDLTRPEFWFEQSPTRESFVLIDVQGRVFFLKVVFLDSENVELHIQFPPQDDREQTLRIAQALIVGLDWLEGMLRRRGVKNLAFDSVSSGLVSFAINKLHFKKTKDVRLEKSLEV